MSTEFEKFPKIPRVQNCQVIITEKIDGTNAQVLVPEDPAEQLLIGSRNRWITPGKTTDNFGFAAYVAENEAAIRLLGPGHHFGEWWGPGIGRGYQPQVEVRRWSLFRYTREWPEGLPSSIDRVPVLYHRQLDMFFGGQEIANAINSLRTSGSVAAPGFMTPEGVVININGHLFKYIFDKQGPSPEES